MTTKPPLSKDPSMDLLYVIGDPEGQVDLLAKMLQKIQHNPSQLPFAENDKIVVMGNYIHHSEASGRDMIDLLRSTSDTLKGQVVVLRGMNEHKLLKNRGSFHTSPLGQQFISSYRLRRKSTGLHHNYSRLECKQLVKDTQWLAKNTVRFLDTSKYFFSPSGVAAHLTDLDSQNLNALMHTGEVFVRSQKKFEKLIVHGTVLSKGKVDIKANRINVNTSCATTNVLSCAVLNDKDGTVKEIITVKAA